VSVRLPSIVAASVLLMLSAGAAGDARAQGGALDAPMNPIGKTDAAPPRCAKCPAIQAKELEMRRVADRSAPEYQGGRRPVSDPEIDSPGNANLGLSGAQLPIALPLR
jgi:hypothetical protein